MKSVQVRSFFWSVFSCIRTEYGDLLRKSPYQSNAGKYEPEKTAYLDTFHAVFVGFCPHPGIWHNPRIHMENKLVPKISFENLAQLMTSSECSSGLRMWNSFLTYQWKCKTTSLSIFDHQSDDESFNLSSDLQSQRSRGCIVNISSSGTG